MKLLDDKTAIPMGLAVLVIGGGAMWLTNLAIQTDAHGQSLEKIEVIHHEYMKELQTIKTDIAIIKTKLQNIEELNKRRGR